MYRLLPNNKWQEDPLVLVQAQFKNKVVLTELLKELDQIKAMSLSKTKIEVNTSNIEWEIFQTTNGNILRNEAIYCKKKQVNDKEFTYKLILIYFYFICRRL